MSAHKCYPINVSPDYDETNYYDDETIMMAMMMMMLIHFHTLRKNCQ